MKAKNKRNLIIMALLMVCLTAALIILQNVNKEEEPEVKKTGGLITNFHQSEISKISYQYRDKEKLNYSYVKDTWYNADDEQFPLSSPAFANNFVEKYVAMEAISEIEDPGDESSYGFDAPYLTIWVENVGGETETLYVGDFNSMLQAYYLKIEGRDNLYTIGTDLLYICREDMYDYAQMETFPSYSKDTLKDITMNNDGIITKLAYFADGYETDLIGQCKWFFGAPFDYYRSVETNKIEEFESDVLSLLKFSKMANYKPTEEEIEGYGLRNSNRQYIINDTVTNEETGAVINRTQTVDFGNYDEETECYYARVTVTKGNVKEVSGNVYLVNKASVDSLLGVDPLGYIYKHVLYIKLIDLADENSDITFITPDGEYILKNKTTFREDGSEDQNIYYINDQLMEESDVEGFYYDILANCGIEQIIYDKSRVVKDKEPTYTVTYHRNKTDENGSKIYEDSFFGCEPVVTYTEYDANYYQASINGYTDVLVNKRLLDETMAKLANMS